MEKPSSTSDSGGVSAYNTVFIDTTLDTHLAMIVSISDTVSDLKKKILYEHQLCFPDVGGIKIHALKVKRKGQFYHLSDSMFVKSAFDGVIKSWFLSVDASILKEQSEIQHSGKPKFGGLVACLGVRNNSSADGIGLLHDSPARKLSGIDDSSSLPQVRRDQLAKEKPSADNNTDNNCNIFSIESNNRLDSELQEKFYNKDTVTNIVGKEDNSTSGIGDAHCNISMEEAPQTVSVVKRKSKTKKRTVDETHNHVLEEKNAVANVSDIVISQQDHTLPDKDLVVEGRGTVVTHDKEKESKDIADEACRISSSNTNHKSQNKLLMTDVLCEENAVLLKHDMCETLNAKDAVVNVNCEMSNKEDSPWPAKKKKQKTLRSNDNRSSSKENNVLAFDSTEETSGQRITFTQCSSGEKQKGSNATLNQLSCDNLLTTEPSSGKRKRKKKSSKILNHVVTTVSSSAQKDRQENPGDAVGVQRCNLEREPDAAVFLGQSVQGEMTSEPCSSPVMEVSASLEEVGENHKVPRSVCVDMSISAVNVESKDDPPELTAASAAKRIRISEDHHTIEAEGCPPFVVQESNNLNKDTEVSKDVNVIVQGHQKSGSDQTSRVVEVNELSQNKDSDAILSAKCTPSGGDELESNSKVVISNLLDATGNVEPGKSSKKRKSKKTWVPITSDIEHKRSSVIGTSSTEPNETLQYDQPSDKSKKEEVLSSPVEGKEVSKTTTVNTSVLVNDRETGNVIQNVLESLQDIGEIPVNAENKVEKSRKKTKRKRSSASESPPELLTEDENFSCKNVALSIDGAMEVDASSKLTKQTSFKHQLNGSNPVPEDNVGIESNILHAQLNPGIVNSSQVITHTPEGNNEGRPLRDLNGSFPKNGHIDEANNKAEVAYENNRTVGNDNVLPSQDQHEIVFSHDRPVDKKTKAKEVFNELKAGKDRKMLDIRSNGPSIDLPSSLKYEKERSGRKAQAKESSSDELQRSLSKGEVNKLHTTTEQTKVSGIEAKAPASKKSDKLSKDAKSTRPNAVNASGKRTAARKSKEDVTASNSTLESSKNLLPPSKRGNRHQSHVDVRKVSRNNDSGEVVNISYHRKSLLATSGTIFNEDNDGSSDDEDGLHNSDNSTRTPSDNSLSDYSDGDSRAQQNGFDSPKRDQSGRRNITNSGNYSVNLGTVLRSSMRYKAAKLTASQSQLQDTESQYVEFVPDN